VYDLANHAFGPPHANDALFVRVLQERMPRMAAFLMLAGIISSPPQGQPTVDWARLKQLFEDPGTLVNEDLWDTLLGDAGIPGSGRMPAVLIALLILFPQTILALARNQLKVLPLGAAPSDAPGPWRDFRTNSDGWISFTIPFPDPAKPDNQKVPRTLFDLVADLQPNLSATVGIRSNRRLVGADSVTDFELWLALAVDSDVWQYDFGKGWNLKVTPGIAAGFGHDGSWHGAFRAFNMASLSHPLGPNDPVVVSFGRDLPGGAPDLALGPPYDTRLIARDLGLYLKVRENHPIFEIGAFLHEFSVVLTNRWWRTFGATNELFGEGIHFDLTFDLAYVESRGVVLNLSSGLDVTFNLEWTALGDRNAAKKPFDLTIHSVRLHVPIQATQSSFDIRAEVRFHASLRIGPVVIVVDGLGGWGGYWTEDGSKHYVGFLPPTGAGIELALPAVTGGGFLDFTGGPNERFGGLLHLKLSGFEVTAFGLHELTGAPGQPNRKTSFIIVIGIRFFPGIQLGFGFEISGFGGLVGINRRADTDALRERLTSGAAGNVLFAEDPVRNAPSILGDLGALFPPADGVYVFGPTIQLSWLNIAGYKFVRLDVGIFIELPGPSKIILLGSARAEIPGAAVLLYLRIDLVGIVDFNKKVIEFDATLINSHALEIFVVTGDAAFRSSYGSDPYAMLTVGGFHPHFNPEPAVFPELTRVALTLKSSISFLFLRFEAYLAVTTNTFQFGGALEIGIHAGPLNAIGFVTLDALIQFTPFHFEVSISAGFRIRWNSFNLAGIKVEGTITGPGPIVLSASFCIELLFFDICWSDSFTLGSSGDPAPAPLGSTAQALQPELADPKNLSAVGGDDPHAAQQRRGTPTRAVVSPLGQLTWTQKRAPLNVLIERFEGQPLAARQSLALDASITHSPTRDWFAPGSYTTLSQSEALNRPSFEHLDAGALLGFGDDSSASVNHPLNVVEIRLPARNRFAGAVLQFALLSLLAASERTSSAAVRTTDAKFTVADEQFVVHGAGGGVVLGARSQFDAQQRARVVGGVALPAQDVVTVGGL
jgi:hypothetical protein